MISDNRSDASEIDRVVVINDFSVIRGGASGLALESACQALCSGNRVTYVSGDRQERRDLPCDIEYLPIDDSRLLEKSLFAAGLDGLWNPRLTALRSWIAECDTPRTVYHLHNWCQILSPAVLHALRSVSERVIMHAHDFALACPTGTFFDYSIGAPCRLAPASLSCVTRNCDKRSGVQKAWRMARFALTYSFLGHARGATPIVLTCKEMTPYMMRAGYAREQLHVFENPVHPISDTRIVAEANSEILFVGRVVHEKGVELAASAARAAGVRLRVIGDGDMLDVIRARFPEVIFEGWSTRDRIIAAAREARILIGLSQTIEAFGLTFVEAAAAGLPVLLSTNCLIGERLESLGAGWIVDVRRLDDVASVVGRLMQDDEMIQRASLAGHAARKFLAKSNREWGQQLADLYARTIRRSAGMREDDGSRERSSSACAARVEA